MRLNLQVAVGLSNWQEVLELIKSLEKNNGLSKQQAESLRKQTQYEIMTGLTDISESKKFWKTLPDQAKSDTRLLQKLARSLLENGEKEAAKKHLETYLAQHEDAELIKLYVDCSDSGSSATNSLAQTEKWLVKRPHDVSLLLAMGRLCVKQQLWSKAQEYFEASMAIKVTSQAQLEMARLLDKLDKDEEAQKYWRKLALLNEASEDGTEVAEQPKLTPLVNAQGDTASKTD